MGIKDLSDLELIVRLKELSDSEENSVSKQYCEEFYTRYYKQVYNFCRYYGLNSGDAEDASQESFIKLFKNVHSFKQDKQFKPWFFKLVYHKVLDKYRELKKSRFHDIETVEEMPDDKAENISEKFQIQDYWMSIIHELPEKLKTVLVMYIYNDLDYNAISAAIGLSSRQVRNRVEQALALVKKAAEEKNG